MNLGSFISLLFNNLHEYVILAFIILITYYVVFHRYIFSVYDPLFFNSFLSSSFATTTVVFLFLNKKIELVYFANYLITVFCFYFVFYMFGKKIPKESNLKFRREKKKVCVKNYYYQNDDFGMSFWISFVVFASFNILIQLYFYIKMGIPLFMDSRLSVQINGGAIIGLLTRIKHLLDTLSLFMTFFVLCNSDARKRIVAKLYIIFLFSVSLLSGSKGGLIGYVFIFAVFIFYTQKKNQKWVTRITNPKSIIVLFIGGLSVLLIIHIQQRGNLLETINHLILRFAAYGDGYVYAYPNDTITKLNNPGFFKFLFGDFLYTFRLLDGRLVGLGFELSNIIYHVNNSVTGPNPRFNIAGYAYFGFAGSVILALISGFIFTFGRNILVSALDDKPSKQVFAYCISSLVLSIETDICQVIVNLTTNLLLQSIFVVVVSFLIIYAKPKKNMNYRLCNTTL